MAITRYTVRNPVFSALPDFEAVSDRFARFFEDSPVSARTNGGSWTPAVNVEETQDELVLSAELPGLSEDAISIQLENNVLTISGEKTEERTEGEEERRYHLWERRHGAFQRSFKLPRTVKADGIRADYENGILRVRLPKQEEAKGRTITIEKAS
jgi:HSP20 family protein